MLRRSHSLPAGLVLMTLALAGCQTTAKPPETGSVQTATAAVDPDIKRILAGGGLDPSAPAAVAGAAPVAKTAGIAPGLVPVGPPPGSAAAAAYAAQQPSQANPLTAPGQPLNVTPAQTGVTPVAAPMAAAIASAGHGTKGKASRKRGRVDVPMPQIEVTQGAPVQAHPALPVVQSPLLAAGTGVLPVPVPGGVPTAAISPALPAGLTTSLIPAPLAPQMIDITGPNARYRAEAPRAKAAAVSEPLPAPAPAAPEPYVPKIKRF
mgnify:FL=1